MESDESPHHPAASTPAGAGGSGRAPSPWELDLDWRDAPRDEVKRRPPPPKMAKPAAPLPAPPEFLAAPPEKVEETAAPTAPPPRPEPVRKKVAAEPSAQPQPVEQRAPEAYVPIVRRQRVAPRREGSWLGMILLCMGLLLFVFVAWQYLHDEPRGADDDLRPLRPPDQTPVSHSPQKLRRFLEAIVALPAGTMPSTPPWTWDTPTLSRFFKGNGAALDNLGDLLEDADWHPAHSAWHLDDLGADPRWPLAFVLKQAESAYFARLGQEEAAFVAAIDLADLAKRLEDVWAWPSFYTRALDGHERAAQALAELLKHTRLPEQTLRQVQRQFSLCQPSTETLVQALNAFYLHEKKLIFGPASGEPLDTMPGGTQLKRPGRLFFKPYTTLQLFMEHFRRLKMEAHAPLANVGMISVKDSAALHQHGYQPNSAGEAYAAARMAGYRSLPAKMGLARARDALVITLFAVRRCVAEQRTLPPTLESLKPRYLLDVPLDPFAAAPLQYDSRHGWIWSVGTDLRSQGGAPTSPAMQEADEPTVEIGIGMAVNVP